MLTRAIAPSPHRIPSADAPGRRAGIQQAKLFLEDIRDGVLDLGGAAFRGILEVAPINLALRSAPEQEQVLAGFRAFLNGLSFPIQILVRIERLGAEDYQALLAERARREPSPALRALALAQASFVRELVSEKTLLRRRFFLVFPAPPARSVPRSNGDWLSFLRPSPVRGGPPISRARQQLLQRQAELLRGLEGVGLRARPLDTTEVLGLYFAMLCPALARVQSLTQQVAEALRPVVQAVRREVA